MCVFADFPEGVEKFVQQHLALSKSRVALSDSLKVLYMLRSSARDVRSARREVEGWKKEAETLMKGMRAYDEDLLAPLIGQLEWIMVMTCPASAKKVL